MHVLAWMTSMVRAAALCRLGNLCDEGSEFERSKLLAISRPKQSYSRGVCCGGKSFHLFLPQIFADQL